MNRAPKPASSPLGKYDRTVSMQMDVPDNANNVLSYEYNLFEIARAKIRGNHVPLAHHRCSVWRGGGKDGR